MTCSQGTNILKGPRTAPSSLFFFRFYALFLLGCLFVVSSCATLPEQRRTITAEKIIKPPRYVPPPDPIKDNLPDEKSVFDEQRGLCELRYIPAEKLTDEAFNYRRQNQILNGKLSKKPLVTFYQPSPQKTRVEDLDFVWKQKQSVSLLVAVLWSTECKPCLQGLPKLQGLLSKLNKNKKVHVMTISESADPAKWEKVLSEQKNFWAMTPHTHIVSGASGAAVFCTDLDQYHTRPLVVALDKNWVVRQALVYPFDEQRQQAFLQGIQRLTSPLQKTKAAILEAISQVDVRNAVSKLATQQRLLGYQMADVVSTLISSKKSKPVRFLRHAGPQLVYLSPQPSLDSDPERMWIEKELISPTKAAAFLPYERLTFQWFSAPNLSQSLLLLTDGTGLVRQAGWGPFGNVEKSTLLADIHRIAQTMKPASVPPPSPKTKPQKRKK